MREIEITGGTRKMPRDYAWGGSGRAYMEVVTADLGGTDGGFYCPSRWFLARKMAIQVGDASCFLLVMLCFLKPKQRCF